MVDVSPKDDAVKQIMAVLTRRQQDVFRLRWCEGRKIGEISGWLGITRQAVHLRLANASRRLVENGYPAPVANRRPCPN